MGFTLTAGSAALPLGLLAVQRLVPPSVPSAQPSHEPGGARLQEARVASCGGTKKRLSTSCSDLAHALLLVGNGLRVEVDGALGAAQRSVRGADAGAALGRVQHIEVTVEVEVDLRIEAC